MTIDAAATLSLEIQQALQQAVGNVNDAANVTKKKKKRNREPNELDNPDSGNPEKRSKKKKKYQSRAEDVVSTPSSSSTPGRTLEPGEEAVTNFDATSQSPKEKKKKNKKDKGKGRAREEPVLPTETEVVSVDDDLVASSADFLSAVVAAANATAQPQDQPALPPPPPSYPPHTPPYPPYPEQYLSYPPPPGFPYPPPCSYSSTPHMFPDVRGIPIPDLNIATSEELLQTLQALDTSQIASVLRSLGEAGSSGNISLNTQPQFVPGLPPPIPPSVRQVPAKSEQILGRQSGVKKRVFPKAPTPPQGDEHNPDHAYMLANVWMSPSKLSEMVERQGLVYKKGKFSAIEEAQLAAAVQRYRDSRGLTEDDIIDLIFSKEKGRDAFWTEITGALHLRPIIAVYHHVRRQYHPLARRGKWTPSEDYLLNTSVADLGQQWERVAERVGRAAGDCRDRYRNHLANRDKRVAGCWAKEEEDLLTRIVTDMTINQGKNMDNDIFWGVVSDRMGGRRGRQQCRIKWTDSLSTQFKNDGQRPRWSAIDAYLLVRKIDSLNVRDDTEIDWKTLPDDDWNSWSAHSLQRRWLTMKRGVKGYEEMSHAEIMDILRTKKAQEPPQVTSRKKSKVTSAEAVDDSEDDSENEDENQGRGNVAGPSTQAFPPPVIAVGT